MSLAGAAFSSNVSCIRAQCVELLICLFWVEYFKHRQINSGPKLLGRGGGHNSAHVGGNSA